MKLKELIKKVERLNEVKDEPVAIATRNKLEGIKETVEAVDKYYPRLMGEGFKEEREDWEKLKELLSLSNTTDKEKS